MTSINSHKTWNVDEILDTTGNIYNNYHSKIIWIQLYRIDKHTEEHLTQVEYNPKLYISGTEMGRCGWFAHARVCVGLVLGGVGGV